jgi:effector-binding domain-containing protein
VAYDVRIETVQSRLIATARGEIGKDNLLDVAFPLSRLAWDFLKAHPEIPGTGTNIWCYRLDCQTWMVEAGAEVLEEFEGEGPIACSKTPAGQVAVTKHVGPYSGIQDAHGAIRAWAETNNWGLLGPNWEVYGHRQEDESKLETEVYYSLI